MSKTLVKDWLQSSSDSEGSDLDARFDKQEFEGDKGHLRLQLQKTYKGDERFKLDKNFTVETKSKHHLPDDLFGSLSKREKDNLFHNKRPVKQVTNEVDSDAENRKWDMDLDVAREKSKAFDILAKLVPQSEIYLSSKPSAKTSSSAQKQQFSQIKRFDPTKPNSELLKIKDSTAREDDGRMEVLQKRNIAPKTA